MSAMGATASTLVPAAANSSKHPRVVVIGGGFAGLAVVKGLARADVEVLLVDRSNHHLFQPLLYQVATAGLSPADIARPLREVLRGQRNATVLMAEVARIDVQEQTVAFASGEEVSYDYCVVAVGARHSYFDHGDWEEFAPGLKTLGDALEIRSRTFRSYERAERDAELARVGSSPGAQREPPTFVVVGGGPTGVEMAGALAEIARQTMRRNFRRIAPARSRVVLVEALDSLLSNYPAELRQAARRQLEGLGVEVRLETRVSEVTAEGVRLSAASAREGDSTEGDAEGRGARRGGEEEEEEFLATRNVVWAAGNEVSPLVASLGVEVDRAGRALVRDDLSIPGHEHVFVLGDAAHIEDEEGELVPGVAPAAMQSGRAVARAIRADLDGEQRKPFCYLDKGSMATIGRARAVAWIGKLRFGGLAAWLAWSLIHIFFLIGFRNRVIVMLEWITLYLTSQRSGRLLYDRAAASARRDLS